MGMHACFVLFCSRAHTCCILYYVAWAIIESNISANGEEVQNASHGLDCSCSLSLTEPGSRVDQQKYGWDELQDVILNFGVAAGCDPELWSIGVVACCWYHDT